MEALLSGSYVCASCFRVNEIEIDVVAGLKQTYVEDCSVCCRPNVQHISIDEMNGEASVEVDRES
jgi:hypothetical protein